MPTAWRQGDLLAPDDAVALGLIEQAQRDTRRALVISHSCDIASDENKEPKVELLIGEVVQQAAATSQNGHSIRVLHLAAGGLSAIEWVQYGIAERREVPKAELIAARTLDRTALHGGSARAATSMAGATVRPL